MKDEAVRERIEHELAKASRAADAATRNAAAADYETAANRLYYAALHMAKAVLATEGLEPKSHRGVRQLLVVHFVADERLPEWAEPALARLETERDLADYAAEFVTPQERYDKCRTEADRLMTALEEYLRSEGWIS